MVNAEVGLTNYVSFWLGKGGCKVREKVKRGAGAGIKEEAEVDAKGEVKDDKLVVKISAKVGAEEVEVAIAKIFGFCAKTSCKFKGFGAIEW